MLQVSNIRAHAYISYACNDALVMRRAPCTLQHATRNTQHIAATGESRRQRRQEEERRGGGGGTCSCMMCIMRAVRGMKLSCVHVVE